MSKVNNIRQEGEHIYWDEKEGGYRINIYTDIGLAVGKAKRLTVLQTINKQ